MANILCFVLVKTSFLAVWPSVTLLSKENRCTLRMHKWCAWTFGLGLCLALASLAASILVGFCDPRSLGSPLQSGNLARCLAALPLPLACCLVYVGTYPLRDEPALEKVYWVAFVFGVLGLVLYPTWLLSFS